jgi:hypothetical protein
MMGCVGGLREIRSSQYAGRRTAISGNFTKSKWLSELAHPESEFVFAAKSWNPNPLISNFPFRFVGPDRRVFQKKAARI